MRWQTGTGGPRWVEVAPERFVGWVESFAQRHGETTAEPGPDVVVFRAADGAVAECHVPSAVAACCRPPVAGSPAASGPATRGPVAGSPAASGPATRGPATGAPGAAGSSQPGRGVAAAGHAPAREAELIAGTRPPTGRWPCCWSGSAGTPPGCSPADPPRLAASKVGLPPRARAQRGRRPVPAAVRPAPGEAGQRTRSSAAADTAVGGVRPLPRPMDAVVLGGDRRAMAGLRERPAAGALLRPGGGPVPHRARPRLRCSRQTPRMFRGRIRVSRRRRPAPANPGDGWPGLRCPGYEAAVLGGRAREMRCAVHVA